MLSRPSIAITMGDPAGIGPELAIRAAAAFANQADITVYGADPLLSETAFRLLGTHSVKICVTGQLSGTDFIPGKDQSICGLAALAALDRATDDALVGQIDAIVTAPMSKCAVNMAGIPFQGHTERIAERCGVSDFAMMQSAESIMYVTFVTTHIPLSTVSGALTVDRIVSVIKMLERARREDGVTHPRIAVAALNPHAGEGGYLGGEEKLVIEPAIRECREAGIDVHGPVVPDVLFIPAVLKQYDGAVCMYHDQGHIPFKMTAFDCGVNSTLGLPIIRTSPDHGTAYDLIEKEISPNTGSLFAAVRAAIRRAEFRRSRT